MTPQEIAEEVAHECIHPVWKDVGGNFFKQGFVRGYWIGYGRAPVWTWLLVGIAVGFVLGSVA